MARIHNEVGSVSNLLRIVNGRGEIRFNSLEEIIAFNGGFKKELSNVESDTKITLNTELNQLKETLPGMKSDYESQLRERQSLLNQEIASIDSSINNLPTTELNFLGRLIVNYRKNRLTGKKEALQKDFDILAKKPLKDLERQISDSNNKIAHIENNFNTILKEMSESKITNLNLTKKLIDENYATYAGAIGEQKVLETIKKFPDAYVLINNFHHRFGRALHKRNTDDWIQSIQVDHLLIGPPGVLVIETKNWSKDSVENKELYSPIQQIQRSSYAIFMLLNQIEGVDFSRNNHWGQVKIPVHNILLMINNKPRQEFQYVKVLTLETLYSHVSSLKPVFRNDEIMEISNVLLRNNHELD
jgi:hypothetical protein